MHHVRVAPRTYYAWRARGLSRRALWDTTIAELLAGYYHSDRSGRRRPESLYGAVKMWAHLNRQGVPVARCTVERLMRAHGWRGAGRRRPESLDGAVKMWAHLSRQGVPVARCTVERLMRAHGWRGVRRDRRVRTTISAPTGRVADLVDRCFRVAAPNQLFVADFTY